MSVHFMSTHDNWSTPTDVYEELNKEFNFTDDPCPIGGDNGLDREWGISTFCNPPYSDLKIWAKKGYDEWKKGKTIVFLVPSRTDTKYWHEYFMKASEIRFIKGRLKFGDSKNSAPFPSAIIVFRGVNEETL